MLQENRVPGSFNDLGLDPALVQALSKEGITVPSDIQRSVIPVVRTGRNLMFRSPTGTGKTLAYLLPVFEKYKSSVSRESNVLILAPTHELTAQVKRQIDALAQDSGLNVRGQALMGTANMERQIDKLKTKPRLLVGSPGRVLELIQKRKINCQTVHTVILDEADQLLDEHNSVTVQAILKSLLRDRQVIACSASLSDKTLEILKKLTGESDVIRSDSTDSIPDSIEHVFLDIEQRDKIETLRKLIQNLKPVKSLVFLNKTDQIAILDSKLNHHGIRTGILHGDAFQIDRKQAVDDFRSGKRTVLIASDLAARGLQMDGVSHVFNMDIPEDPKKYLHRAGRTGRMGVAGIVVSLATPREQEFLKAAEKAWGIAIRRMVFFGGMLRDPSDL
jgi:superfamily II DNA/RNA helicase